jgi:hypothetical protein
MKTIGYLTSTLMMLKRCYRHIKVVMKIDLFAVHNCVLTYHLIYCLLLDCNTPPTKAVLEICPRANWI